MHRKTYYVAILFFVILVSCAPKLPNLEHPTEIKKEFNESFYKTWDAVLEVIKISKGVIITSDKSSGLLTYTIHDKESKSKIYLNVYLKSNSNSDVTTVFFYANTRTGPYLKQIDRDFFETLTKILRG